MQYKKILFGILSCLLQSSVFASWNVGINVGNNRPQTVQPPMKPHSPNRPLPPQNQRPPHNQPPHRPTQPNGVYFNYQAPSYSNYNHQTYIWVNGDPNSTSIKSSTYEVITDWERLGLPAPPQGMYWIFEDGRYMLVPKN